MLLQLSVFPAVTGSYVLPQPGSPRTGTKGAVDDDHR
jgi:hypothetical protein